MVITNQHNLVVWFRFAASCYDDAAAAVSGAVVVISASSPQLDTNAAAANKVGQSVFYDCIDLSPMAEKQDTMKADRSSDTDEESECFFSPRPISRFVRVAAENDIL